MNDITARFAAMADRVATEERGVPKGLREGAASAMATVWPQGRLSAQSAAPSTRAAERQQPPSVAASSGPHQGRAFSGWPARASLDDQVAEELASLERDDSPPPAIDPHDGPVRPKTNDARGRAIAYVSRLIGDYTSMRRNPGSYKVGLTGKLEHLRSELGIMQSAGKDGEILARRWDSVVGDGRGGQYGARGIA